MIQWFDSAMAEAVGLNKAIFLKSLEGWISHNAKRESNFKDGKYWSYNTTKALKETFPYISERTIKTIIKELRDDGYIETGNFNTLPFDRTLWFTLTDKYYELNKNCTIDSANLAQSEVKNLPNQIVQELPNDTISTIGNNSIKEKDISSDESPDISKEKPKKKRFQGINPSREEVEAYIKEKGYHITADEVIRYYTTEGKFNVWRLNDGSLVKDWQRCCGTFESNWRKRNASTGREADMSRAADPDAEKKRRWDNDPQIIKARENMKRIREERARKNGLAVNQ